MLNFLKKNRIEKMFYFCKQGLRNLEIPNKPWQKMKKNYCMNLQDKQYFFKKPVKNFNTNLEKHKRITLENINFIKN